MGEMPGVGGRFARLGICFRPPSLHVKHCSAQNGMPPPQKKKSKFYIEMCAFGPAE